MWRVLILFIINHFLSKTHFYKLKRFLLNTIKNVKIEKNVRIVGPLFFGKIQSLEVKAGTWIGRHFQIEGNGCVLINENVDIGPQVTLLTGTHQISYEGNRRAGSGKQLKIVIGNGCWVCGKVTILGDSSIGEMSVIGASSLVKGDVPKNVLYAGVPAVFRRELE